MRRTKTAKQYYDLCDKLHELQAQIDETERKLAETIVHLKESARAEIREETGYELPLEDNYMMSQHIADIRA